MFTSEHFDVGDTVKVVGKSTSSSLIGYTGVIKNKFNRYCNISFERIGDHQVYYSDLLNISRPYVPKEQTKHKCFICKKNGVTNYKIFNLERVNKPLTSDMYKEVPLCIDHISELQGLETPSIKLKTIGTKKEKGIIQSDRTFGVELESFTRSNINELVLYKLMNKNHGGGGDGSIRPNRGYSTRVEVRCAPMCGLLGENELINQCELMKELDFKVNDSCGTHCHIGVPEYRKLTNKVEERLRILLLFYTVFDPVIRSLLPKSRRDNSYCSAISKSGYVKFDEKTKKPCGNFEKTKKFTEIASYSRYGINFSALNEHSTIEVRYHEGTLDAKRLIHWIALHTAIIDLVMDGGITEEQVLDFSKFDDVKLLLGGLLEILGDRLLEESVAEIKARYNSYKGINHKDKFIKEIITVKNGGEDEW